MYILVGTCDFQTLRSLLVSLNRIYFEEAFCFKQLHVVKKLNRRIFRRGKKKSFKIVTFWGRKKQVLKSLRFMEDLGRFQAFFFWNEFMKGVLTLTPFTPPKEDDRTDRHLKYHIYKSKHGGVCLSVQVLKSRFQKRNNLRDVISTNE